MQNVEGESVFNWKLISTNEMCVVDKSQLYVSHIVQKDF